MPARFGLFEFVLEFFLLTLADVEGIGSGGLAPNQRPVIARLGIRALLAGSLANLMSAALAGLLLPA